MTIPLSRALLYTIGAMVRFLPFFLTALLAQTLISATGEPASPKNHLCTVAELNQLFEGPSSPVFHFALTGAVTVVSKPSAPGKWGSFVLQDHTDRGYFFSKTLPQFPEAGSSVIVRGRAFVGRSMEPWMENLSVTKIGCVALAEPSFIPLARLEDREVKLTIVRTSATVIDVFPDDLGPVHDFILLKDNETIIPAIGPHDPAYRKLIDAKVEVTGLVQWSVLGERKYLGSSLSIGGIGSFKVLTPPPQDIFALPVVSPNLYIRPRDILRQSRRTASGVVLAVWQRNRLLIGTDNNQLVGILLASNETLPPYGARITASGYPTTDLFRINLTQAKIRIDATNCLREESPPQTKQELFPIQHGSCSSYFENKNFGKLVTVRGIVRALPLPQNKERQLILDSNSTRFSVDFTANPTAADGLEPDSEIEVTGRFVPEMSEWQPMDVLPRINGFTLVIRKADDIRVVSGPPWLTVRKLLVVVGVLLAALIGLYVRSLVRKRYNRMKLKERTQLAVELHDSLSQALTGLACQIAGAQMDDDIDSSRRKLTTADQMLQSCRTELKNCLFDLRNDTMTETSFDKAIRRTLEPLADQAEIHVRFNVNRERFDDFAAHSILVMIRELVANAIRHGHAWTVKVAGTVEDGKLFFSVTDDGCGFDPTSCPASDQGHFGLDGIRERIKRLNGTFEIQSHPKRRTKAVITIPITRK